MLAAHRWTRIEPLFDRALELPPAARAGFVAETSGGDVALEREIRRLLEASDAAAESFLEGSAAELAAPLLRERPLPPPRDETLDVPERIGPWRVVRLLGRGGMGVVFLAERDDERYDRRVALKLVPAGPLDPPFRARFLLEQRILASLEHPNIARMYDAGVREDGTPYFVMEYVEGRRLDAFCDERALSIRARLELFQQVCEAVQLAHRRLVVHRDLKPGNILVSDDGAVKLLDFGIAKLLRTESDGRTLTGLDGFQALTPEYASPEQLRGEPVSTSTDVYALGVLLFELLAGRWPYRPADRSVLACRQAVLEQEPERPSAAATAEAADRRSTTVAALRRQLRGDLDNIVLTALRKEPEERYASVRHLQEDVRNYLERRPVTARPATWRYRAGTFVRRHRVGVAAAMLVAASLVAGLVATSWQARAASREAARADRVRDFVVELLQVSDPDQARGETVTALALLDQGAERLATELTEEPAVRAEMLAVLGTIYQRLGLYDRARPLLEEALDLRVAQFGRGHLETAQGSLQLASILHDQGEFGRAEELARRALEVRLRRLGPEDTLVAAGMSSLAAILNARGEHAEAEELNRAALGIDRRHGSRHRVAADLNNLSVTLWRRGNLAEASALAEESLALRRELHGEEHTEVATALVNTATVLRDMGEFRRAEALYREALVMRRKLLGDEHPYVAIVLNELSLLLQEEGRLAEMEEVLREALAIRRAALGDRHPDVGQSLNQVAIVLYMRRDFAGAAEHLEQALEIWQPTLGDAHPHVLTGLANLGAVRRELGDLAGAERAIREALELRLEVLGEGHPDIGSSYNNLALVLARRGMHEEAEAKYRAALAAWRSALGPDHPDVAYALVNLGRFLSDRDRQDEAEGLLREGLEIVLARVDPEGARVAEARLHLGRVLLGLGRLEEAEPLLLASYPALREHRGEDNPQTRLARRTLAELYTAWRRPEDALAYTP